MATTRLRFRAALLGVVLCLGGLAFAGDRPETLEEGKLAPELAVGQWQGSKELKLDDLVGKVVVVDFFGVWCAPCRTAVPKLQKLHTDYKGKDLVILGIHTKLQADKLAAFVEKEKLEYAVCVDVNGDTAKRFKIQTFPTVVVLDKKGLVKTTSREVPTNDELDKLLAQK